MTLAIDARSAEIPNRRLLLAELFGTTARMTDAVPAANDTAFFGHPRGVAYLAFTECWERFSYYGMTSLLTLYMVQQLFLPGHAEHVLGLAALRQIFGWHGTLSDVAFASLIYGWYGGLVYFTPILGGLIADRWLGAKATVVIGALLMCAGHLAMAFDVSFLIALLLLILGSGCLKGNISAQVGELYPVEAESRRTQGYTIFSAGINVGAILGPLACGALAAGYGWHVGFGAAAALMLLALVIYLAGQRHLASRGRSRRTDRVELPPMTAADRKRTWLLILVAAMTLFPNVAYPMIWSIGVLWVDQHVSLWTPWGGVPPAWFNSIDPFASVVAVPPLVALWAWQAKRGREPSDVAKIGIGSLLTGLSALVLVAGALLPGADGKTAVWWALAGFFGMGVAFLYYWPVLLALISQAAPKQVTGTLMGGVFLSFFLGSVIMGWVGSFYDTMSPAAFWTLDGGIGIVGGLLVLAIARPVSRALEPVPDGDAAPR